MRLKITKMYKEHAYGIGGVKNDLKEIHIIVACCSSLGLEVHVRHEHGSNGLRIYPVYLRFTKADAFSAKVDVQRIDDIDVHIFVKKKSEEVVAVMSSSLKSYLSFICGIGARTNGLQ